MEQQELNYLKENIQKRIEGIDKRRMHYRSRSFYSFISTAALAAISSILLGLKIEDKWFSEGIRIAVLVISCSITIINTYSLFFNHKELWIANNEALNSFYALQFDIGYKETHKQPLTPIELDDYKKRYQQILDILNKAWYSARSDDNEKATK